MKRYDCLKILSNYVKDDDLVVTSLGGLMDEWHNLRPSEANLPLHILGVISPLSLGLSIALPKKRIICIDTDGSLFLNIGALCTIGNEQPANLIIYVLDNECYECIGGYPTPSAGNTDIATIAKGCGIKGARTVNSEEQFEQESKKAFEGKGPSFIVCKIEPGTERYPAEKRIPWDGFELKYRFIRFIEKTEGITIKPPEERYDFRADEKKK
jgi:sulfopyruvate decarboxylase subunit beta